MIEQPEFVRLSLAAAMTLGFSHGRFYRNAQLRCINVLLTPDSGCSANCAYCGLGREKRKTYGDHDFIRVAWNKYKTEDVLKRLESAPAWVERICISMITNTRCRTETLELVQHLREHSALPISVLISPTIMQRDDLQALKAAGVDRIGVAVDCATEELFRLYRGEGVRGPHSWDHYWTIYAQSIEIFGKGMAGVHLISGLGETEQQLVQSIARSRAMGGNTHLFSFYPEKGSALEGRPQAPAEPYRRIQLARYLIDSDRVTGADMRFNERGQIIDFGLEPMALEQEIRKGYAFETSGCIGASGRTACNRPYGNEKPGPDIRNFPFVPELEDISVIRRQLVAYDSIEATR